ncbi:hypothetical protein BC940DRAFT_306000 [Gongronella butleri]|nr:hypothetical protein BC940DRAFT_306000 [Gongronella butleri]
MPISVPTTDGKANELQASLFIQKQLEFETRYQNRCSIFFIFVHGGLHDLLDVLVTIFILDDSVDNGLLNDNLIAIFIHSFIGGLLDFLVVFSFRGHDCNGLYVSFFFCGSLSPRFYTLFYAHHSRGATG